jgi:hypothetical protein
LEDCLIWSNIHYAFNKAEVPFRIIYPSGIRPVIWHAIVDDTQRDLVDVKEVYDLLEHNRPSGA